MKASTSKAKSIFIELVEKVPRDQWDQYLDKSCGDDHELRQQIESLLDAHTDEDFLAVPAIAPTAAEPFTEQLLDTEIGPYRIRELLSEGGMGVVFVAEQTEPVRRKVALKIIKPGMDSQQILARFESERQALAMMDHPNIARIIDAGTTESGRPYFVMELVYGVPITEYCDQHKLTTEARLEIFVRVCRAVQHAHQKGIIHRDLKPSNVLVASIDGEGVPKVIDFGIAKATGSKMVDVTVYTQFSQIVGTPLYMSPEQAELGVADIDTRSDVYALGVMLYELVTGSTPFDSETLKQAGFDEMRRIIREDEPPRPSAKVSTLRAEALSTVSQRRGSDPRRLCRSLEGELDWIVMKALEKRRDRRYESSSAMAADVERYLSGEAVEACPPSTSYVIGKYVRRHKGALTTATIALGLLLLGLAGTGWQAWRATKARAAALENFQQAQDTVDALLTEIEEDPSLESPELQPLRSRLFGVALEHYQNFVDNAKEDAALQPELAEAHLRLGEIAWVLGEQDKGTAAHRQAIAIRRQLAAAKPGDPQRKRDLAETLLQVARASQTDKLDHLRAAVEAAKPLENSDLEYTLANSRLELASALLGSYALNSGDTSERDECLQAAEAAKPILERLRQASPANNAYAFAMIRILDVLSQHRHLEGKYSQADALQRQAVTILDELAKEPVDDTSKQEQLAEGYARVANHLKAIEIYEQLVAAHPLNVKYQEWLIDQFYYAARDGVKDQIQLLQSAADVARGLHQRFPNGKQYAGKLGVTLGWLASAQVDRGQTDDAIVSLKASIEILETIKPKLIGHLGDSYSNLSESYELLGNLIAAIEARQQAIRVNRKLREDFPNNLQFVSAGAHAHLHAAKLFRQADNLAQALVEVRLASALIETTFADGTPDAPAMKVFSAQIALRDSYHQEGKLLCLRGQYAEAAIAFRKALDTEANAVCAAPKIFFFNFPNPTYDAWLEVVQHEPDAEAKVESTFRDGLAKWQAIQEVSDNQCFQVRELEVQLRLAEWLSRAGREAEAADSYSQARAILLQLTARHSKWMAHAVSVGLQVCRPTEGNGDQRGPRLEFIEQLMAFTEPALEIARQEIKDAPWKESLWDTWSRIAVGYYHEREWQGAASEAQVAMDLAGEDLRAVQKMAPLALLAGDNAQYRTVCEDLLPTLTSRSGDALQQALQICLLEPPSGSAAKLLEAARRLPSTSGALHLQHVAAYSGGDFKTAIEGLESLLATDVEARPLVQLHLAIANKLQGNNDDAARWLERAEADRVRLWRTESQIQFEVLWSKVAPAARASESKGSSSDEATEQN